MGSGKKPVRLSIGILYRGEFNPLPLIQEELVVSYLRNNGNSILVNCLKEACQGTA